MGALSLLNVFYFLNNEHRLFMKKINICFKIKMVLGDQRPETFKKGKWWSDFGEITTPVL